MLDSETWRQKRCEVLDEVLDEVEQLGINGDLHARELTILRAMLRSLKAGVPFNMPTYKAGTGPQADGSFIVPTYFDKNNPDAKRRTITVVHNDPETIDMRPHGRGQMTLTLRFDGKVHTIPILTTDSVDDICWRINNAVGSQVALGAHDLEKIFDAQGEVTLLETMRSLDAIER
jgi:hypothetical protein